jgi:hypothetical protein
MPPGGNPRRKDALAELAPGAILIEVGEAKNPIPPVFGWHEILRFAQDDRKRNRDSLRCGGSEKSGSPMSRCERKGNGFFCWLLVGREGNFAMLFEGKEAVFFRPTSLPFREGTEG